ncbi:nitrous oxide reductase accessory protein NosL [Desulfomonile tiedjei]|uniref:Putative lipoprotein involved in nitrous oxide reduction n=1 Tax=Desulfomonile tiedjei (strain ATCC 49306 / DSM 6799 / DCB-1) TaxID=706587 RepID=I4C5W5_DESTA|nr:nitrous oxide reductase accessory protein NosL [Desulfomonile tiedjei]AFM24956.1 putative lipoprotein involved in nitrous oxide reduction [Desulfomonile tiedjei DSM 6799]
MYEKHSPRMFSRVITISIILVFVAIHVSHADQFLQLPDGSKVDLSHKCPVCGMVIGGRDGQGVTVTFKEGRVVGFHGVAAAVFKDGRVVGFDGARCLFIYNSVPQKYDINVADLARQYVTDFVTKKMIELRTAFLVLGSEVKGPMGYELIAFSNMDGAAKFASNNDGKWIVQLHEVARAAQEEPADIGVKEKTEPPSVAEEKVPAPAVEPSTAQPKEQAIEAPRRRTAPQRRQRSDPYEPSVGGRGHHGGGHH